MINATKKKESPESSKLTREKPHDQLTRYILPAPQTLLRWNRTARQNHLSASAADTPQKPDDTHAHMELLKWVTVADTIIATVCGCKWLHGCRVPSPCMRTWAVAYTKCHSLCDTQFVHLLTVHLLLPYLINTYELTNKYHVHMQLCFKQQMQRNVLLHCAFTNTSLVNRSILVVKFE